MKLVFIYVAIITKNTQDIIFFDNNGTLHAWAYHVLDHFLYLYLFLPVTKPSLSEICTEHIKPANTAYKPS